MKMQDHDGSSLDPGVARLVGFLRGLGFETVDSGDGVSKFAAGTADDSTLRIPHVAIRVEYREDLFDLADQLKFAVQDVLRRGAKPDWRIEASYDPRDHSCVILLTGVADEHLKKRLPGS